jgi:HlyD family secretion protein
MTTSKKWVLAIAGVAVLAGMVYGSIRYTQQGVVTVQTGRVIRQDLAAQVTASGEVRPRNYINIGAQHIGRLTEILVKEGDRVKKGQLVAKLETIQPAAEVEAQQAALRTAQAELIAAEAAIRSWDENLRTVQAAVDRAKADRERAAADYDRATQLLASQLIARQQYEQQKAVYEAAVASVTEAEARVLQIQAQREQGVAQRDSVQRRIEQTRAGLTRVSDVLQKHYSVSPIDGVVTNLPVRVGETVVPGIQNSPASLIMTIADMSLITAEVKVDETDIVSVHLGQPAQVTIDALPGRTFPGRIIEIGNTAILRSSGLATSQFSVSTQEAKDFKVVVALDDPPEVLRPGLSCTARITTAVREQVLTIPIQALTVRTLADLEPENRGSATTQAAAKAHVASTLPPGGRERDEQQGVFLVRDSRSEFQPVTTGIMGASDIEVLGGLEQGQEIVIGPYRVLRTIRPGARVKVDNRAPRRGEEK